MAGARAQPTAKRRTQPGKKDAAHPNKQKRNQSAPPRKSQVKEAQGKKDSPKDRKSAPPAPAPKPQAVDRAPLKARKLVESENEHIQPGKTHNKASGWGLGFTQSCPYRAPAQSCTDDSADIKKWLSSSAPNPKKKAKG